MRLFKCPDGWGQGYCAPFVDGPAVRPPSKPSRGGSGCFFIFIVGALLFAIFVYLFFFLK